MRSYFKVNSKIKKKEKRKKKETTGNKNNCLDEVKKKKKVNSLHEVVLFACFVVLQRIY